MQILHWPRFGRTAMPRQQRWNVETRWLQDFLGLADAGSFTRAATARHSSQAAFSRRIQSLEQWLGTTLVDRGAYPARLTAEGERFREHAADILSRILQSRGELQGRPTASRVRVAIPYALATTALPGWWSAWADGATECQVVNGNVHDLVAALVAGTVDLLVCFGSAQQPIQLDPARYDRATLRHDRLRPYARRGSAAAAAWPGRAGRPVPLLRYPATVYFGRLVALAIEAAPGALHGVSAAECEMSDVLRGFALAGQGVAWLPDCSLSPADHEQLVAVDDGAWSVDVSTLAFRDRTQSRPAVDRLWARLSTPQPTQGA